MSDPTPTNSLALSPCPECGGECVRAHTVLGSFGVQGTGGYLAEATALYAANPAAVLPKRS